MRDGLADQLAGGLILGRQPLTATGAEVNSAPFAVVIVLIPVAVPMPTVVVFIPPSVSHLPAVLPRFVQLLAPMSGLLAPVSVMLNRFVELVIGPRDPTLASVLGPQARCAGQ